MVTKISLGFSDASGESRVGGELGLFEICSDLIDVVLDMTCIYTDARIGDKDSCQSPISPDDEKEQFSSSGALIQLSNGTVVYLKQVDRFLVFIGMLREENYDRPHLLDYNLSVFKDSLGKLGRQRMNSDIG